MENLDKNLKVLMGENLSGAEMMNLCSTNKNFRRQCMSETMSLYWIKKLNEDYHIYYDEKDSFSEYLRQSWMSGQKLYHSNCAPTQVFRTEEDAINNSIQVSFPELIINPLEIVGEIGNTISNYTGYQACSIYDSKIDVYRGFNYYSFYDEISKEVSDLLGKNILKTHDLNKIITSIALTAIDVVPTKEEIARSIRKRVITSIDLKTAEKIAEIFLKWNTTINITH